MKSVNMNRCLNKCHFKLSENSIRPKIYVWALIMSKSLKHDEKQSLSISLQFIGDFDIESIHTKCEKCQHSFLSKLAHDKISSTCYKVIYIHVLPPFPFCSIYPYNFALKTYLFFSSIPFLFSSSSFFCYVNIVSSFKKKKQKHTKN